MRLRVCFKLIADLYNKINSENTENITPFQEWLLDNFYIIEREYRVAKSALRGIGKLNIRYKKGKPCVYMAAEEALAGFNFKAEKYSVLLYLREDGKSFQMTTDELYIFPVMLKAAIIDKIAEVCKDGTDKDGVMIGRLITSFRRVSPNIICFRIIPRANTEEKYLIFQKKAVLAKKRLPKKS